MQGTRVLVAVIMAWLTATLPAHAEISVIASIKPVHSLVASIMQGAGEPALIVDGAASPHAYHLKPSQARELQDADLVFWVGPQMESFLEKPIETIGANARTPSLLDSPGLRLLDIREDGEFAAHVDRDGHADSHDDEHDHAHDHHGIDAHVWLDPANAKAMTAAIVETIAGADPQNAAIYRRNGEALMARLDALNEEIAARMVPVHGREYVVFHDGYRYFETRFGVSAAGALTVNPDSKPGAARLAAIRETVEHLDVQCVFSEPQFDPALVNVVREGTHARVAVLDPLGAGLAPGPELYFDLMEAMAVSFADCLSGES